MSATTFISPANAQRYQSKMRNRIRPHMLVTTGNIALILSAIGLIASILIAYTHAYLFSMASQVVAHITMMLTAGTLKLGYIVRLNGTHLLKNSRGSANQ